MRFSTIPSLALKSHASVKAGFRPYYHVRRQMAAGQGGFHAGALSHRFGAAPGTMGCFTGADFLYVYDCGSDPKKHVHREINTLLAARPERHLDLLVLSHFDRDHICGTPELLRTPDGFNVDTIMLPFVDMDERIVALAQAAAEQEDDGGYIDRFFIDMVFDPVETLGRFGPRRIILVRGDGDDAPMDGAEPPDFDPDERKTRAEGHDRPIDGEDPIKMALVDAYRDPQRPAGQKFRGTASGAQVVEVRNIALALFDTDLSVEWKLLPWVRPAASADVAAFRTKVETLFGWPAGSFATQVLKPAVRHQMAVTKRTKLAQAYKEAFGDKNLTSLCLYSGPRHPARTQAAALLPRLSNHPLTKIGWLGTGDAHLKDPGDIAAFKHGYAQDLAYVSSYLFPHHGSIKNSDPNDLIVEADLWVAAADPIHAWEHPHWALQGAVAAMGKLFRHVRASVPTASHELFIVIGTP